MMVQKTSVCQICGCNCGLLVTLDGGQIDSGRSELDPIAMRWGMRLVQPDFGTLLENGFNTPSGKIELYSTWLAQKGYPPLPVCEDSCQCCDRFPYRLVTGARSNAFNHSQHRNIPDLLKLCPVPEAEISPKIAADMGVFDDEFIVIENCSSNFDSIHCISTSFLKSSIIYYLISFYFYLQVINSYVVKLFNTIKFTKLM